AANYGHANILQTLIYHGVDRNTRSSISDNTVLHAAVKCGHIESIKVLVEAGCNLSLHSEGKTPLDLALNQRSSHIVQYLLDNGA
ncbi:ankyrin repeat-containing domain protein, partial [Armillaria novae-zelandiae]